MLKGLKKVKVAFVRGEMLADTVWFPVESLNQNKTAYPE